MLSTHSNYLATAKRVRISRQQSQQVSAQLAAEAEEETARANELMDELDTYTPEVGSTHAHLTVRDTFEGEIRALRMRVMAGTVPSSSSDIWQTEPFTAGDITVFNRIPLYLPGLSSTEEGSPLLLTDLRVTQHLRVKGTGLHVYSLKFPSFTTPQTVPYSAAVIADYTAKMGSFPSSLVATAIQKVDAWPNIPLTSTSVTQLNSASAPNINNGDGALVLAPTIPLPVTLPAINSSLLVSQNTATLHFHHIADTAALNRSRETGIAASSAADAFSALTVYNRWYYADSRIHYNLPIIANLTHTRTVLMPNSANVYGPATAKRPMFIYHPSAIITVQASVILSEVLSIDKIEIWVRMRKQNGALYTLFGGHPYVMGVYETFGTGLMPEDGTVTVDAPVFQFPLNNIEVTNDSASVQVAINAHFKTEDLTPPAHVESRIDCMISITSTSF